MEKNLVLKFKLPLIENLSFLNALVSIGYRQTGNKFSINFNGSKGYMSNVEITCEGIQKERNNIIWVEDLKTRKGKLMNKMVKIFHSEENGIRVEVQGQKDPEYHETMSYAKEALEDLPDDLPF